MQKMSAGMRLGVIGATLASFTFSGCGSNEERGADIVPAPGVPMGELIRTDEEHSAIASELAKLDEKLTSAVQQLELDLNGHGVPRIKVKNVQTIKDLRPILDDTEKDVLQLLRRTTDPAERQLLFDYSKDLGEARGAIAWIPSFGNDTLPANAATPLMGLLSRTRALENLLAIR